MKTIQNHSVSALAAATLIVLGACAGMTAQEKGSATGGVAGNIGGVIGHEVTKTK